MTKKDTISLEKWNRKINEARKENLLTEELLFQLYFQTTYDVWYLSHNRSREDRTGVLEKDVEDVLAFRQAFVTPLCTALREDFNLNPTAKVEDEEEDRNRFMAWYDEQKQQSEGDSPEAKEICRRVQASWDVIDKL